MLNSLSFVFLNHPALDYHNNMHVWRERMQKRWCLARLPSHIPPNTRRLHSYLRAFWIKILRRSASERLERKMARIPHIVL